MSNYFDHLFVCITSPLPDFNCKVFHYNAQLHKMENTQAYSAVHCTDSKNNAVNGISARNRKHRGVGAKSAE